MSNTIYAVARAKAKEASLLGQNRLNRMIDSSSFDEAIKILAEVGFGGGSLDDTADFEKLISSETALLYDFIKEACPTEEVKKFFLISNDYENAKAFVVNKYLKTDVSLSLTNDGLYKKDFMLDKILTDDYRFFTDNLKKALLESDELFVSKNYDGFKLGGIFSKYLFKDLEFFAKKSKVIREILKVKADTTNITIALRARDYNLVKDYFVCGGTLSSKDLKSLCEDSFDSLLDRFRISSVKEFILSAIEDLKLNKPFVDFEQKADDFALKFLSKYKYVFEGEAPFILYCYYKLAEISNVRIILVGLKNNFEIEDIKKRLRLGYAG